MTTAGPLVIRELSGDQRVVELVGRALPYRPLSMRTEQRVSFTWLPGAPEATSTVLGAKEGTTAISGMWKQKYLDTSLSGDTPPFKLDNQAISTVTEAVDTIDSFCRLGQLMEFTWLTTRRLGHLIAFDVQWDDFNDVAWTMDFTWVSRGEVPSAAVFAGGVSQTDVFGSMQTQFSIFDTIRFPSIFGLTTDFVGTYRNFVNNLNDLILDLESGIVQFADQILTPFQVTRGLIATLTSIIDEVDLILDFFDSQVAGNLNNSSPIGNQRFIEHLEAEQYRRENEIWAREMRLIAKERRDALFESIAGDLAGTYVARDDEDLRTVAKLFYGTPFEWRRIMLFNGLRNAELFAGQLILVPKLSPDETNQLVIGA